MGWCRSSQSIRRSGQRPMAARLAALLLVAGCATAPRSPRREVPPPPAATTVARAPDALPRPLCGAVEFVMTSRQVPGAVVALFGADGVVRVQPFGWRDP